jgi:hypothetical protein
LGFRLRAALYPYGVLTGCLAQRAPAEGRQQKTLVPSIDLTSVRPVSQRLSRELYEAAKRFVLDFRDGHTKSIQGEMEPELYESPRVACPAVNV